MTIEKRPQEDWTHIVVLTEGVIWNATCFLMRLLIALELALVNVLKTCRSFRFIRKSVYCLQFALGHSFRTRDNNEHEIISNDIQIN